MKGNRKLIVTLSAMGVVLILALASRMTADVALVLSVCVGGFHAANGFEHRYNGAPRES